jgi:hypothetical protein
MLWQIIPNKVKYSGKKINNTDSRFGLFYTYSFLVISFSSLRLIKYFVSTFRSSS